MGQARKTAPPPVRQDTASLVGAWVTQGWIWPTPLPRFQLTQTQGLPPNWRGPWPGSWAYQPGWNIWINTNSSVFEALAVPGAPALWATSTDPAFVKPGLWRAIRGQPDSYGSFYYELPSYQPGPVQVSDVLSAIDTAHQWSLANAFYGAQFISEDGLIHDFGAGVGPQFMFGAWPNTVTQPTFVTPDWQTGPGYFVRWNVDADGTLQFWRREGPGGFYVENPIQYGNSVFPLLASRLPVPSDPNNPVTSRKDSGGNVIWTDVYGLDYRIEQPDGTIIVNEVQFSPISFSPNQTGERNVFYSDDNTVRQHTFPPNYWKAFFFTADQISKLPPALTIALYYSILAWHLTPSGSLGGQCPQVNPNSVVCPGVLSQADAYVREYSLRALIYNTRQDLHTIPNGNGGTIPGLIPPDQIPWANGLVCVQSLAVTVGIAVIESLTTFIPFLGLAISLAKFAYQTINTFKVEDEIAALKNFGAEENAAYNAALSVANAGSALYQQWFAAGQPTQTVSTNPNNPTTGQTTTTPTPPVTPVVPVVPTTPTPPVTPVVPVVPTTPVAPTTPATPVVPVVPTAPSTPAVPVTPVVPAVPIVPTTPTTPAVPTTPVVPTTPATPTPTPTPTPAPASTIPAAAVIVSLGVLYLLSL